MRTLTLILFLSMIPISGALTKDHTKGLARPTQEGTKPSERQKSIAIPEDIYSKILEKPLLKRALAQSRHEAALKQLEIERLTLVGADADLSKAIDHAKEALGISHDEW